MEDKREEGLILEELLKAQVAHLRYETHDGSVGQYTKQYETWKRGRNILRYFRDEEHRIKGPLHIADIGCGNGIYIWLLSHYLHDRQADLRGIDISESSVYLARKMQERFGVKDAHFSVADASDTGLPSAWADIVLCSEVIEHIARPDRCLAEMMRMLKPGGVAIITTPNQNNLIRAVKWMFNPFYKHPQKDILKPEEKEAIWTGGHVSIKGLGEWVRIFKNSGFIVERVRRGSLFCGGTKYDSFPLLFSISIILDAILDYIPFTGAVTENLAFKLRKP